jgi:hypothetical protein
MDIDKLIPEYGRFMGRVSFSSLMDIDKLIHSSGFHNYGGSFSALFVQEPLYSLQCCIPNNMVTI